MAQDILIVLDNAHRALRMVDASNTTKPQTDETLDAVCESVAEIERTAWQIGFQLSEMAAAGFPPPTPAPTSALRTAAAEVVRVWEGWPDMIDGVSWRSSIDAAIEALRVALTGEK